MKKYISILLALAIVFTFAACSKTTVQETETNAEIQGYLDDGYDFTMSGSVEGYWAGLLVKDGSYIKVSAPLTEERETLLNALDIADEDYDAKENALIATFMDATCEDITSMIPTEEDLQAYVGKTVGELEDEGLMYTEWEISEENYILQFDCSTYTFNATVSETVNSSNRDDLSENDIRDLTIATVEFYDLSWGALGLD